ncbi:MAG: hypothetical protein V4487_03400 [Chlamydiota bacterium]
MSSQMAIIARSLTCPVISKLYSFENPPYTLPCCSFNICLDAIVTLARYKNCPNPSCKEKKFNIHFEGNTLKMNEHPLHINKIILSIANAFGIIQQSSAASNSSQNSKNSTEKTKEPLKKEEDHPVYILSEIRHSQGNRSFCSLEEFYRPHPGLLKINVFNHSPLTYLSIEFEENAFVSSSLLCDVTLHFEGDIDLSVIESFFKKLDISMKNISKRLCFSFHTDSQTITFTPTTYDAHKIQLNALWKKIKDFFPPDQAKILEPIFLKGAKK